MSVRVAGRVWLAGLLAGCTALHGAPEPRPVGAMRFMVYNIHAGKDAAGVDNLAGVAELVRRTGADVVLLQEVDNGTRRSGSVDQPAVLADRTGFHVAFGSALDYDGGKYGVAILSRWPIVSDTLVHLPVTPPQTRAGGSHEPRGALRVVVASPEGRIAIINTHLDPTGDDRWRRQEADSIVSIATQARAREPLVIVGGDFNSTPESAVQGAVRAGGLRDAWTLCASGEGLTYPADAPSKRIDYLYLTGALGCAGARVVETRVSDHRPLVVDVVRSGTAPP
jgi:endonuclease/exonuclease/phosphatase family metal-dependent hydrolase